ncbi:hypothetical protein PV325_000341, partial [Microctonus aethiopoides]
SETDGLLKNGQQTKTEKCKSALKALITDELDEYEKLINSLETESKFKNEDDSESEPEIESNFGSEPCVQMNQNPSKKMRFNTSEKTVSRSCKWKSWAESIDQVI